MNLSSLNFTTESVQEWEVTFPNNSHPMHELESGNPSTFLPGWKVDANSGLTISDVGLGLNGTMLVCVAVGANEEVRSEAVILFVGG